MWFQQGSAVPCVSRVKLISFKFLLPGTFPFWICGIAILFIWWLFGTWLPFADYLKTLCMCFKQQTTEQLKICVCDEVARIDEVLYSVIKNFTVCLKKIQSFLGVAHHLHPIFQV